LGENNPKKCLKTQAFAIFRKDNKVKHENEGALYQMTTHVAESKENAINQTMMRINLNQKLDDSLHFYFNLALKNDEPLDLKFIDSLLDKGVDINYENENSDTILFEVC
jgi:hypothetical protein